MQKPWLLLTEGEKKERVNIYLECISITPPVDEALLVGIRPPRSRLEALIELYIYSCWMRIRKC